MGEYQETQDFEGLKPTKYVLGSKTTDGHEHVFYLRDDLPIATTSAPTGITIGEHAHSISEGPDDTVISDTILGHHHTVLTVKSKGDYKLRTHHI